MFKRFKKKRHSELYIYKDINEKEEKIRPYDEWLEEDFRKTIERGFQALLDNKKVSLFPTDRSYELALEIKRRYVTYHTQLISNSIVIEQKAMNGKITIKKIK